jgi:hypothetical protein
LSFPSAPRWDRHSYLSKGLQLNPVRLRVIKVVLPIGVGDPLRQPHAGGRRGARTADLGVALGSAGRGERGKEECGHGFTIRKDAAEGGWEADVRARAPMWIKWGW